jgi:VanZ family protein
VGRILFRTAAILGAIAIAVLSLLPGRHAIAVPTPDVLSHLCAYLVLTLACCLGWTPRGMALAIWAAALGIYGSTLETLQLAVPGRSFEPVEVLMNLVGVGVGVLAWAVLWRRQEKVPES